MGEIYDEGGELRDTVLREERLETEMDRRSERETRTGNGHEKYRNGHIYPRHGKWRRLLRLSRDDSMSRILGTRKIQLNSTSHPHLQYRYAFFAG